MRSILLWPLVARCLEIIDVCIWRMIVFMSVVVIVWGLWNLGLWQLSESACMYIVSKALFISSVSVIIRAGGVIWLNPFATVLFTVCSAVTVKCCVFHPCCVDVFAVM